MGKENSEKRVRVWNRVEERKQCGTAAPLERNIAKFLRKNPDYDVYTGQDKVSGHKADLEAKFGRCNPTERVTIWNRVDRRKLSGNCAPFRRNLEKYFSSHPEWEVYVNQDSKKVYGSSGNKRNLHTPQCEVEKEVELSADAISPRLDTERYSGGSFHREYCEDWDGVGSLEKNCDVEAGCSQSSESISYSVSIPKSEEIGRMNEDFLFMNYNSEADGDILPQLFPRKEDLSEFPNLSSSMLGNGRSSSDPLDSDSYPVLD